MTEDFLQYIWKYRLFNSPQLTATSGQVVEVYQSGLHNKNAGPDFLNARVKIGEQTWSGHVEVHIRASDWNRHKHSENEQYKNVILHVVYENDADIFLHQKGDLPVFVMKGFFDEQQWQRYQNWLDSGTWIPCEKQIHEASALTWMSWKDRLIVERLEQKSLRVRELLKLVNNDWQEAFYRIIARSFGFKTNSDGMEMLAESISQKVLAKHRSDPFQVEALLFGQAGMLENSPQDEYPKSLKEEYIFLKKKYELQPIPTSVWKWSKLRPSNFPTIRIAQLADLVCKSEHLFSTVLETENTDNLIDLFCVDAHPYWLNHYRFDTLSIDKTSVKMGNKSIQNILINAIVPMIFAYGQYYDNEKLIDRSQKILEICSTENNHIIEEWNRLGVKANHALDSQSLLWLYNEYCSKKRCLSCAIGLDLLKRNSRR